ncbi:MAG: HTH-type transcriptional regulator [Herbinix sp.]|jgi:transcriptional regulator with XRE-family HTH domain|nr:HTH-type transcriptional regulator [Herbinix sp.]
MNDLGNRIKQLRLNKQLSQQQLSQLIDCTSSSVSAFEQGTRNPSIDTLKSLSRVLGASTDYLLGLNTKNRDPNLIDVSALTESQRIAIKQLIESIKKK